jgi:hypothetical protein
MSKKQNNKVATPKKPTQTPTPTQTPPADTENGEVTKDLKKKKTPEERRAAADEQIAAGKYGAAVQTLFGKEEGGNE